VGTERTVIEEDLEVHTRVTGSAIRRIPGSPPPDHLDILRVVGLGG
jgi:hypothetical protein